MLAGMALKRRWATRQPPGWAGRPNLVMGNNVQVYWEKFCNYWEVEPRSINTSGHKYGLVYPGVGWVLWRHREYLPEELIFNVNYLGGDMPTFALNFSRPGAEVVAQYYTFLRLGREGFRAVPQASRDVATSLAAGIARLGPFRLGTRRRQLPEVALTTRRHAPFNALGLSPRVTEP